MGLRDDLDQLAHALELGPHFVIFYQRGEVNSIPLLTPEEYVEAYDEWHDRTGLGYARHNYPRKQRFF